jgi:hypothetical protein
MRFRESYYPNTTSHNIEMEPPSIALQSKVFGRVPALPIPFSDRRERAVWPDKPCRRAFSESGLIVLGPGLSTV